MKYFLILFLSTYTFFGQNIEGKVIDAETKDPIENVSVYFKNLAIGTTTNKKGYFSLKTDSDYKTLYSISFSIIGYYGKSITFTKLKKNNFIINLSKKTEQLEEVRLLSNRKLKKEIPFKKLAPLKNGVHSFGSLLVDDKIYLIGGDGSFLEDTGKKALLEIQTIPNATFDDLLRRMRINPTYENYMDKLQTYNITNNTWEKSEFKFRKRAYHNINHINNTIYILGGKRLSLNKKKEYLDETIEVYNLKKDSIIIDYTNPHQAINFASFTYKNNLIIMGGSIKQNKMGEKVYSNKSHIYNSESGYWYELYNMPSAKEVKGVLIDDIIYVIGGSNGESLKTIETYNITTETWESEGELFNSIDFPGLAYHNNLIYIYDYDKISTYNILNKTLNEYNINLNLKSARIHYYKNKIYIVGGYIENEYSRIPSSYLFSIHIDDFETTEIIQSKLFSQESITN
tara:strand:+ start:14968 stop:16338 length:1371 start_codon:yes stop_codon:yes gene_type:complete